MRYANGCLVLLSVWLTLAAPRCVIADEEDDRGVLQLQDVLAAMQFNHAAADERYVGKELQVQGRALRVARYRPDKDAPVQYIVTLTAGAADPRSPAVSPDLNFVFPEKERPGLADIRPGAHVVIKGKCCDLAEAAKGMQLRFEDCRLIRIIHEAPPTVTADGAPESSTGAPTAPRATPPGGFPMVPPRAIPFPMR